MAIRRLKKEWKDWSEPSRSRLPDNCYAELSNAEDYFTWRVLLVGPRDTPYEDGHFYIEFKFPQDYPFKPVQMTFENKIYHPQVYERGYFTLSGRQEREYWSPAITVMVLMNLIKEMLINPDPEIAAVIDIAKKFKSNRAEFNIHAKEWTEKFANNYVSGTPLADSVLTAVSKLNQHKIIRHNFLNYALL